MERNRTTWAIFLAGVLIGCVAMGAVAVIMLAKVRQQGLTVGVNTGAIAAAVESQVKDVIRQQMPAILAEAKQEVVRRVSAETAQALKDASIDVGGFKAKLPAALAQRVQQGVESALTAGMERAITDQAVSRVAGQMGDRAFVLVRSNLDRYIAGQKLTVHPWPWYSVPIVLKPM